MPPKRSKKQKSFLKIDKIKIQNMEKHVKKSKEKTKKIKIKKLNIFQKNQN